MTPLISYIIPAYNVPEDLLKECLESIKPSCDFEIIVVDDGSDVPVLEMPGITIIRQDNNQGLSAARNTGLSLAKGEYIQFVDADDALIPEPYTEVVEILKAHKPDIINFSFRRGVSHTPGVSRGMGRMRYASTSGSEYLQRHNLRTSACSYIFRRDMLGDLRFEPDIQNEDERFTPQLYLRANSVIATDIPAYFYRQREGSLQHIYSETFLSKRFNDLLATLIYLKGLGEPALERRIRQLTMDCLYNAICLSAQSREASNPSNHRISFEEIISKLRNCNLFPLPHRCYTVKYWLFSHIVNNRCGRRLLQILLPLLPKEQ